LIRILPVAEIMRPWTLCVFKPMLLIIKKNKIKEEEESLPVEFNWTSAQQQMIKNSVIYIMLISWCVTFSTLFLILLGFERSFRLPYKRSNKSSSWWRHNHRKNVTGGLGEPCSFFVFVFAVFVLDLSCCQRRQKLLSCHKKQQTIGSPYRSHFISIFAIWIWVVF
jgi:hypothetical protein